MKEQILQRAMRNGIKMPDGRHWTWRGAWALPSSGAAVLARETDNIPGKGSNS